MSPLEAGALVVVGLAIGAYASAIGAGGGFLLTPLLLFRHPDASPSEVTMASLIVVAASSGLAAAIAWGERRIDVPVTLSLAAISVPAAFAGAALNNVAPRDVFAAGISALLIALGAYLIRRPLALYVDPVRRGWRREFEDGRGNTYLYRIPVERSLGATGIAAFVSAVSGIGGGVFHVPLLTRVARMPHPLAVPTAHVIIATLAVVVVAFHVIAGHDGTPLSDVPWLGIGVLGGSPAGARLNRRLGEGNLTRLLAVGLLFVGIRTAWSLL